MYRPSRLIVLLALAIAVPSLAIAGQKVFKTTDGKSYVGEVIDEGETGYLIRTGEGETIRLQYGDIEAVIDLEKTEQSPRRERPETSAPVQRDEDEPDRRRDWSSRQSREEFVERIRHGIRRANPKQGDYILEAGRTFGQISSDINDFAVERGYSKRSRRSIGDQPYAGLGLCPVRCDRLDEIIAVYGPQPKIILRYDSREAVPDYVGRGDKCEFYTAGTAILWGAINNRSISIVVDETAAYCGIEPSSRGARPHELSN